MVRIISDGTRRMLCVWTAAWAVGCTGAQSSRETVSDGVQPPKDGQAVASVRSLPRVQPGSEQSHPTQPRTPAVVNVAFHQTQPSPDGRVSGPAVTQPLPNALRGETAYTAPAR